MIAFMGHKMDRNLTSTCWIFVMILSAAASMSPGRLACQVHSITPQEPPTFGEFFRVDQTTGAPTRLEPVQVKKLVGPLQRGGIQTVEFYVEGEVSPVAFKAGEPQQFVIRLMSPGESSGNDLSAIEAREHIELGQLMVKNAKNQRGKPVVGRFVTRTTFPFDIEPFGQSTLGLPPKKPGSAVQSLLLTPRVPLLPGKYQIWIVGVSVFHNALSGGEHWAFDIVTR
jgi:hypothetical protein